MTTKSITTYNPGCPSAKCTGGRSYVQTWYQSYSNSGLHSGPRKAIPPNHVLPSFTFLAHVSVEIFLDDNGVPGWGAIQQPSQGLQKGWAVSPSVWHRSVDNNQDSFPDPKTEGNNAAVHWREIQCLVAIRMPIPALCLSSTATPKMKKIYSFLMAWVPEMMLCVEVSLTIYSQNCSTSSTSSSSFPAREVTSLVPVASLCKQGSNQGPCFDLMTNPQSWRMMPHLCRTPQTKARPPGACQWAPPPGLAQGQDPGKCPDRIFCVLLVGFFKPHFVCPFSKKLFDMGDPSKCKMLLTTQLPG